MIFVKLNDISQFISEAVARIFGPNDDQYPLVGVQPFEGNPYRRRNNTDW